MQRTERGFALIQVLLVFALLAVIVARLQYQQHIQISRAYQSLYLSQAQVYVDSAEAIASLGLRLDAEQTQIDSFNEQWNQPLGPFPVDNGLISLELDDLQGRFNVNWLSAAAADPQASTEGFKRLLLELNLEESIADELRDWFDPDSGADFNYSDQDPSYRPSFLPMADISELRLLKSIDDADYETLAPYVAALGANDPLNINTASAPVVMTLAPFISKDEAEALIEAGGADGYDDVSDFLNQPLFQENETTALFNEQLSVTSQWFDLYAEVQFGDERLRQISRLNRTEEGSVTVTYRTQAISGPNQAPGNTLSDKEEGSTP